MKVIYVAGPYRGASFEEVHANIMAARYWAKKIWKLGAVALCPHLNTWHFELDAGLHDEVYLTGDLVLIQRCDAVFMMPNWEASRGARREKKFSERQGIPVFFNLDKLAKFASGKIYV